MPGTVVEIFSLILASWSPDEYAPLHAAAVMDEEPLAEDNPAFTKAQRFGMIRDDGSFVSRGALIVALAARAGLP